MLPPEEQIPGERLAIRDHVKVVIVEGRRRGPDALVVVSRSHPQLVQRLMEQEVPELQSGQVVIRAIARDPGHRDQGGGRRPGRRRRSPGRVHRPQRGPPAGRHLRARARSRCRSSPGRPTRRPSS